MAHIRIALNSPAYEAGVLTIYTMELNYKDSLTYKDCNLVIIKACTTTINVSNHIINIKMGANIVAAIKKITIFIQ